MSVARPPKKSESLEIRIPYPAKQAFMDRCRRDGTSASEALRALIDEHLEEAASPRAPLLSGAARTALHVVAGALITLVVGAAALPSVARPACDLSANPWAASAPQLHR